MRVEVTTPDSDQEVAARVPQDPAATAEHEVADDVAAAPEAPETPTEEPVEAEYEAEPPAGEKEEGKASDEVFSIADIEAARADAKAASEKYLRLQAEWDNYRKRTAREREEERARAAESLVTKLLPVVDDLERSLDHAAKSRPEGEFGEFVEGVRAVYDKLSDALARTGVEVIDPVGQPFDMNEHQAVANVDDPAVPESTVRDVYQKGYRMGGRVIRTAMVTVAKGGPAREDAPGK